jgi:hypothetical protein
MKWLWKVPACVGIGCAVGYMLGLFLEWRGGCPLGFSMCS